VSTIRQEEHEGADAHARDREAWNLPAPVRRRPGLEHAWRLDEGELREEPAEPPDLDPAA